MKGIRVYWWCGLERKVGRGLVVDVEKRGTILRFSSGEWNPTNSCYLTAEQCRKAHAEPMSSARRVMVRRIRTLEVQLDRIREDLESFREDLEPNS